jgi:16S rRNA (cytosine1402-N4)-methyltransferase
VISFVDPKAHSIILDCTLGSGGHTKKIIEACNGTCSVVALDQDKDAIERSKKILHEYSEKVIYKNNNFVLLDTVLDELGIKGVDFCIMDVGVSKDQLMQADRGFSFLREGPLDMRMDSEQELSAYDVVNTYREDELMRIIRTYGEERFARRIAGAIVEERKKKKIETTTELANLIKRVSHSRKFSRIHPATRTFQALRIEVNKELENLEKALDKVLPFLNEGGIVCVIAFHSLEDRIVKMKFREWARENKVSLLTKKPIIPSDDEVARNPQSRSAKLRVAKRSLHE